TQRSKLSRRIRDWKRISKKKAFTNLKIFLLKRVRRIPFRAAETRLPGLDASISPSSVNRNQEDT
ncbi:MAG TPA: hypothetical protein VGA86_07230, partial [Desulfatiglandales bacterium]